jgi:2-hydroxy-3-oxopropionate reductase
MSVGFIGLGKVGLPMAQRLVQAGHQLVVHDLDPAPIERLADHGARAASSAADVADQAETVLASLPSPASVKGVALGADGVIGGSRVRRFVDLSTVGAPTAAQVSEELARHSIAFVDAPVSGGVSGAVNGTLAIMVAGAPAELPAVEPLLGELGKVFVVGEQPGMGQVMKLVNNYLSATALVSTCEALVVGAKAGLDPQTMIAVLNAGSGRNSATEDKVPRAVLPGTFDVGFAVGLMCKDLGLFADQAETAGAPLWVGSAVRHMWQYANAQLGAEQDITSIARLLEEWVGVELRPGPGSPEL